MPLLTISTNISIDRARQQQVARQASATVSDLLGKPERYVMVIINADQAMVFAGSDEACAYLQLKSLGLPENQTAEFSSRLCELVRETLSVPVDRIYIEFSGPDRHLWGWNSATF